jgi:hypothetical protein
MTDQGRQMTLNQRMARFCIDGWKGKVPLGPMFWRGGAVWFFGYAIERLVVNLFRVPQSPHYIGELFIIDVLLRLSEWVLLAAFIWWCVGVWRAVDHETPGVWPTTARGIVALLVLANAISAMRGLTQ